VAHVKEKLQVDGNQELKWVQNATANIGQCLEQGA